MKKATAIISTDRCFLRPATPGDYAALVAGISAPEFPSELPLAGLYRQGRLKAWLDSVIQMSVDGKACVLSVDLRTGENCIGQVSLAQRDKSGSWSLAFWFQPPYWGKGLASETARAVVQYAFTSMAVAEVWAGAALWNQRSMNALHKIGLAPLQEVNPSIDDSLNAFRAFSVSRDHWMRSAMESSSD